MSSTFPVKRWILQTLSGSYFAMGVSSSAPLSMFIATEPSDMQISASRALVEIMHFTSMGSEVAGLLTSLNCLRILNVNYLQRTKYHKRTLGLFLIQFLAFYPYQ